MATSLTLTLTELCVAQSYAPTDITDLILVTGQSNVQGSQTDSDPSIDTVNERVFAYRLDPFSLVEDWEVADLRQPWDVSGWHPGNGTLQCEANPATCTTPPNKPYNNFAFHFAKTVAEADPNRVVGIIIASAPGKGISYWDEGSSFQQIIADKVHAALNAQGIKTKLDGILWHQGETDWLDSGTSDPAASLPERTEQSYYPRKLAALISNFRSRYWFDEKRPFICGETRAAPVNLHLMALNADGDNWTGCVVGSDLTTRDEQTHFDAAGLRTLGKRYGEKYLEMTTLAPMAEDTTAPQTYISTTSTDTGISAISGYATDAGADNTAGSGFDTVRVAVKNTQSNEWFNFDTKAFSSSFNATHAQLENHNDSSTDWLVPIDLTAGTYKFFAIATDARGNYERTPSDGRKYTTVQIQIDGNTSPPDIDISNPTPNQLVGNNIMLTGTTSATGDTTIQKVRVAIKDTESNHWYNFQQSQFTIGFKHTNATVSDENPETQSWHIAVTLPAGSYKLFVSPIDTSGNYPKTTSGSRDYETTLFTVSAAADDTTPPTTTITTPGSNTATNREELVLSGTASDTGGSGISYIRVALKDTKKNQWYDFEKNVFSDGFGHGRASVTPSGGDTATWNFLPNLSEGRYKFFALAVDGNSNFKTNSSGNRQYETVVFSVE